METEADNGEMLLFFDGEPSPDEMLDMVKILKQKFKKLETRKCERAGGSIEPAEIGQSKPIQRKMNSSLKRRRIEAGGGDTRQRAMQKDVTKVEYKPLAGGALPTVKVRRTAPAMEQAQIASKKDRALDSRLRRLLKSKQKDAVSDVGSTSSNDSGIHLGSVPEEAGGGMVSVCSSTSPEPAAPAAGNREEHSTNPWLPELWNAVEPQAKAAHMTAPPCVSSRVGVAAGWIQSAMPDEKLYVALDCEFVGVGPKGCRSALGRCSVVDYQGKTLCDVYSRPEEPVTDYRTRWSGIRPRHMKNAIPLESARRMIKKILKNKIVVGHSVGNDFGVLGIDHPADMVRDTVTYTPLHLMAASDEDNPPRSLKKLSAALLGRNIQVGPHSSLEDAMATLDLFKLVQYEWEATLARMSTTQQTGSAASRSRRQRTVSETSLENAYLNDDYWPCDL